MLAALISEETWAPRVFPTVLDLFLDLPPPGQVSANTPILIVLLRIRTLAFMCHFFDTAEANHLEALFSSFSSFNVDHPKEAGYRFIGRKRPDIDSPSNDYVLTYNRLKPTAPWAFPAAAMILLGPGGCSQPPKPKMTDDRHPKCRRHA